MTPATWNVNGMQARLGFLQQRRGVRFGVLPASPYCHSRPRRVRLPATWQT